MSSQNEQILGSPEDTILKRSFLYLNTDILNYFLKS